MALKYNDITDFIQDSVNEFSTGIAKTGDFAFRLAEGRIRNEMDTNFPTDSDVPHVIQSDNNSTLVNSIGINMVSAMFTETFDNRLLEMAVSIEDVEQATREYYESNFGDVTSEAVRKAQGIAQTSQTTMLQSMDQSALTEFILQPAMNKMIEDLFANVTVNVMVANAQNKINDRFVHFLRPLAASQLQTSARLINEVYASGFELSWVKYVRRTSKAERRAFCQAHESKLNGDKSYHVDEVKNEFPNWEGGNWDGSIPNTNSQNIFINAGGYNCFHSYEYVKASNVKASDKARARSKGYIE